MMVPYESAIMMVPYEGGTVTREEKNAIQTEVDLMKNAIEEVFTIVMKSSDQFDDQMEKMMKLVAKQLVEQIEKGNVVFLKQISDLLHGNVMFKYLKSGEQELFTTPVEPLLVKAVHEAIEGKVERFMTVQEFNYYCVKTRLDQINVDQISPMDDLKLEAEAGGKKKPPLPEVVIGKLEKMMGIVRRTRKEIRTILEGLKLGFVQPIGYAANLSLQSRIDEIKEELPDKMKEFMKEATSHFRDGKIIPREWSPWFEEVSRQYTDAFSKDVDTTLRNEKLAYDMKQVLSLQSPRYNPVWSKYRDNLLRKAVVTIKNEDKEAQVAGKREKMDDLIRKNRRRFQESDGQFKEQDDVYEYSRFLQILLLEAVQRCCVCFRKEVAVEVLLEVANEIVTFTQMQKTTFDEQGWNRRMRWSEEGDAYTELCRRIVEDVNAPGTTHMKDPVEYLESKYNGDPIEEVTLMDLVRAMLQQHYEFARESDGEGVLQEGDLDRVLDVLTTSQRLGITDNLRCTPRWSTHFFPYVTPAQRRVLKLEKELLLESINKENHERFVWCVVNKDTELFPSNRTASQTLRKGSVVLCEVFDDNNQQLHATKFSSLTFFNKDKYCTVHRVWEPMSRAEIQEDRNRSVRRVAGMGGLAGGAVGGVAGYFKSGNPADAQSGLPALPAPADVPEEWQEPPASPAPSDLLFPVDRFSADLTDTPAKAAGMTETKLGAAVGATVGAALGRAVGGWYYRHLEEGRVLTTDVSHCPLLGDKDIRKRAGVEREIPLAYVFDSYREAESQTDRFRLTRKEKERMVRLRKKKAKAQAEAEKQAQAEAEAQAEAQKQAEEEKKMEAEAAKKAKEKADKIQEEINAYEGFLTLDTFPETKKQHDNLEILLAEGKNEDYDKLQKEYFLKAIIRERNEHMKEVTRSGGKIKKFEINEARQQKLDELDKSAKTKERAEELKQGVKKDWWWLDYQAQQKQADQQLQAAKKRAARAEKRAELAEAMLRAEAMLAKSRRPPASSPGLLDVSMHFPAGSLAWNKANVLSAQRPLRTRFKVESLPH
jgi:hypothetical protein